MSEASVKGDYGELMVCFGFFALFSSCLPYVMILAWLAVVFEIKVDSYKYVYLVKRPFPSKASDIGL